MKGTGKQSCFFGKGCPLRADDWMPLPLDLTYRMIQQEDSAMSKTVVAVIFGGVSSEYEVSLISAKSVLENIPADRYETIMVGITKDGRWLRFTGNPADLPDNRWLEKPEQLTPVCLSPDRSIGGLLVLEKESWSVQKVDVVFPVLHGKNGEDGTMQGLLELSGIPYVGCGVLSSAACMDKTVTHTLLDYAGIPTAKWQQVQQHEMECYDKVEKRLTEALTFPMFVKPANAGSSVGVSKAADTKALRTALEIAFREDSKAVVEEAIIGMEAETAVLGNLDAQAAAVVGELVPAAEFYDYNAKYIDGTTELYIPARLPEETVERLRAMAVKAYKVLGCQGLTRVDFFVQSDGNILLNELNTMPGFTSISMYPKLWQASGVEYKQLIHQLIQYALQHRR